MEKSRKIKYVLKPTKRAKVFWCLYHFKKMLL